MQAGTLRRLVTFLSPSGSQDATGQVTPTWTEVCTVSAEIKPLSGRQLALAQANTITSTATHQIRIRFNPDLVGKVNYKVRYGDPTLGPLPNRFFRINAILDVEERHREMWLTVTEVVS